ncbi:MAG TPA: glucose-6-phosphate dehydrogenase [Candidatus Dormibacteraeota bacterium]|jgi:glucose-6-phosphate 1-dehydrogenase|nr:glucose-6-phosphate dehydrogenase [Candidatus Dormibacteraeota bacterium]
MTAVLAPAATAAPASVPSRAAPPCAVVIVGATGDLARRKLMPALYALAAQGALGEHVTIVGASRQQLSDSEFREQMREAVATHGRLSVQAEVWQRLEPALRYVTLDPHEPRTYTALREVLEWSDRTFGTQGNRLVHLAIPPSAIGETVRELAVSGVVARRPRDHFARIIVEKPFGRDLRSAQDLNRRLHRFLDESQIFRIDHYLGKESVQNLLVLRFANSVFEPIWNAQHIDHVQITVAETVGVEGRGGYYEESGALRDMVQSHLLQLVSLVGMEPPVRLDAGSIRDEKVKLLRSIPSLDEAGVLRSTVRGQYGPGIIDGVPVPGYREEEGVDPQSLRETYAAVRLEVDSWRWAGTPFYLRTGKRLQRRTSEIGVHFRRPPRFLFPTGSGEESRDLENLLIIRIQPDEGITLCVNSKHRGATMRVTPVGLDFWYSGVRDVGVAPPDAYERLLIDAMLGDATLFTREDEVEEAWRFCTSILDWWEAHPPALDEFPNYRAGSWGPHAADLLLAREGRAWRNPSQPSLRAIAES